MKKEVDTTKQKMLGVFLLLFIATYSLASVTIKEVGGWFESGYVIFEKTEKAATYAIYCKSVSGTYHKLDSELVRDYGDYGRADVVGISAGAYQFKIVPIDENSNELSEETTESDIFEVKAYNRYGFAHFNYTGIGAYQNNGQLKPNAQVIYVTAQTAKTVELELAGQKFTGLQAILSACNGKYNHSPLAIRIIGTIYSSDLDAMESSSEGLQIKGRKAHQELNITIEGVGNDATVHGFGFLIRNAKSIEMRNLGIMYCMDDAVSMDTNNSHCWIHNLDLFYGNAGSDSDQAKGDGTIDLKGNSQYITVSYNHFWDSGKSSLCGMTSESGPNYITYHHNWFDHSDSRHPRVRTMTVHVLNNYFDGISKYGIGATTGSSVFAEANYFRNTHKPMLISKQGSDIATDDKGTFSSEDGGIIKSFRNIFAENPSSFQYVTYQQDPVHFDAYEATTRDEQVPADAKAYKGGSTYNNFDTNASLMYEYTPDKAEDIPAILAGNYGAGRMQHGDFQWTFDNSTHDASYAVDTRLKTAIENYRSTLIGIFGSTGNGDIDTPDPDQPDVPAPDQGYSCWFMKGGEYSNPFYTIKGNTSNSKGTATIGETTYEYALKLESTTTLDFNIDEPMTLFLYITGKAGNATIKIDDQKVTATNNTITQKLGAGKHSIRRGDSESYLFYIDLTPEKTTGIQQGSIKQSSNGILYNLKGIPVENPQKGIYIQNGQKIIIR